jgi:hypothetical protein
LLRRPGVGILSAGSKPEQRQQDASQLFGEQILDGDVSDVAAKVAQCNALCGKGRG